MAETTNRDLVAVAIFGVVAQSYYRLGADGASAGRAAEAIVRRIMVATQAGEKRGIELIREVIDQHLEAATPAVHVAESLRRDLPATIENAVAQVVTKGFAAQEVDPDATVN